MMDRDLTYFDLLPKCWWQEGLGHAKHGARTFFWVAHVDGSNQFTLAIICASQGAHWREAGSETDKTGLKSRHSKWDTSTSSGILNLALNNPPVDRFPRNKNVIEAVQMWNSEGTDFGLRI